MQVTKPRNNWWQTHKLAKWRPSLCPSEKNLSRAQCLSEINFVPSGSTGLCTGPRQWPCREVSTGSSEVMQI